MDKLKLTGQNLGQVFNSRLGHACIGHAIVHIANEPNLKLKTRPKQLLGSLPLAFALPGLRCQSISGVKNGSTLKSNGASYFHQFAILSTTIYLLK
jgi:hypothetical protein